VKNIFSAIARLLPIDWSSAKSAPARENREVVRRNFAAIVINGLFFPTAGKILGAGLLLTWFLSEFTMSAFVVGLLVPIQYGVALLAQPWIGQWMSTRSGRVRYYRHQSLVRAAVWCVLAVTVWMASNHSAALLIAVFFSVVAIDAVAAGVGNIAFSDTLARVIPQPLRGRARQVTIR